MPYGRKAPSLQTPRRGSTPTITHLYHASITHYHYPPLPTIPHFHHRRDKLDALDFSWELPSEIKRRKRLLAKQQEKEQQEYDLPVSDTDDMDVDRQSASSSVTSFKGDREAASFAKGSAAAALSRDVEGLVEEGEDAVAAGLPPTPAAKRIKNMQLPGRIAGVPKSVLEYDVSLCFEPSAYREVAAESMREYMLSREFSDDPKVRQISHFEGHLTPQEFNAAITRVIPKDDMEALKKVNR